MVPMIQLIYASSATIHFTLDKLEEMLSAGRARNKARGITGMIVYHQGRFLQILEGEEHVVDALFEKILIDSRHNHVERLLGKRKGRRSERVKSVPVRLLCLRFQVERICQTAI